MGWRKDGSIGGAHRDGRTKAHESIIGGIAKDGFWIGREFSRTNRRLVLSIENLIADPLAFEWRADDGFKRGLIGGADHALARCPNR
jgi:hypothetical protein